MDDKLKRQIKELEKIIGVKINLDADELLDIEEELITTRVSEVVRSFKSKNTASSFLYHILTEDKEPEQISEGAKELHISIESSRVIYLIETRDKECSQVLSVLKSMYPASSKAYFTNINERIIALMLPVDDENHNEEIEHHAFMILSTVNAEAMVSVNISGSDMFTSLYDAGAAYKQSVQAMQVGKMFQYGEEVFLYSELGIGGLISDTSIESCDKYLHEVFGHDIPESLDEETIQVVNVFLKDNLNIAETARSLHMHRNTLIYRIEQIEKRTGLDIRRFEDAMQFKMALMVINYKNQMR